MLPPPENTVDRCGDGDEIKAPWTVLQEKDWILGDFTMCQQGADSMYTAGLPVNYKLGPRWDVVVTK